MVGPPAAGRLFSCRVGPRRRRVIRSAAAAAAIALQGPFPAAAGAQAAVARAHRAAAAAGVVALSNGTTLSRWAYPGEEALVRSRPSERARAIGRLQLLTGDGQAELYLVLREERLASGAAWLRVEVPGRPNGRSGWVPEGALGPLHVVHERLLVDQRSLRATLYDEGREIFNAPIGVGAPGTVTPDGSFYVTEKLITLDDPAYGPYAIGTSAYAPTLSEWPGGGVVGIHGTDEPQLIPGRPSHGCVRMRNADVTRLWHLIALGTPIEIV